MEKIITLLWILFAIYILVFAMILADLWSGVAKARRRGIIRSSYGFRRTVTKTARYYNVLLALTFIDGMQIMAIWYLDTYYDKVIPAFPFITLIGAIGISMIEVKSIYEKAEDKERFDDVGELVGHVMKNRDDMEAILKSLKEYMTSDVEKETKEPASMEAEETIQ